MFWSFCLFDIIYSLLGNLALRGRLKKSLMMSMKNGWDDDYDDEVMREMEYEIGRWP